MQNHDLSYGVLYFHEFSPSDKIPILVKNLEHLNTTYDKLIEKPNANKYQLLELRIKIKNLSTNILNLYNASKMEA